MLLAISSEEMRGIHETILCKMYVMKILEQMV